MRVVLDTNVLFSALISPYGAPAQIYRAWRRARFEVLTSNEQIEELRAVSHYPKIRQRLKPHVVGRLIHQMQHGQVLKLVRVNYETADPDDTFLLEIALAGDADFLITGDRRAGLLQQHHIGRARILTPTAFCEEVL